jgi:hypothetical protein
MALMQADIALKKKQTAWETPRNIALLAGAVAAIAGVLGFKLGQNSPPQPPQTIIIQQPAAPSAK